MIFNYYLVRYRSLAYLCVVLKKSFNLPRDTFFFCLFIKDNIIVFLLLCGRRIYFSLIAYLHLIYFFFFFSLIFYLLNLNILTEMYFYFFFLSFFFVIQQLYLITYKKEYRRIKQIGMLWRVICKRKRLHQFSEPWISLQQAWNKLIALSPIYLALNVTHYKWKLKLLDTKLWFNIQKERWTRAHTGKRASTVFFKLQRNFFILKRLFLSIFY